MKDLKPEKPLEQLATAPPSRSLAGAESAPPDLLVDPTLSAELEDALQDFAPFSNTFLNGLVGFLPGAILAFILFDILVLRAFLVYDPMLLSGLLAAAIAGFLLYTQIRGLPDVLRTLWDRRALGLRKDRRSPASPPAGTPRSLWHWLPAGWRPSRVAPPPLPASFEQAFHAYVGDFQAWLNHRLSWLLGLFFALVLAFSFSYRFGQGFSFAWFGYLFGPIPWVDSLGILGQIVIAYLIGLLAWRMLVIAVQVSRLGDRFDLHVQVQHPDKSGGLKPLGDLCFSNALIISILGIFLGGWIILIDFSLANPGSASLLAGFGGYQRWEPFFRQLLLIFVALAVLAFFMPLYAVHLAMLRKRVEIQQMLDGISARIDQLTMQLLDRAEDMGVEQAEQVAKEIAHLQQVYQNNSQIPVWPFDKIHLFKFVSTQAVPILGLTNIGPGILELVKSLLGLLPT